MKEKIKLRFLKLGILLLIHLFLFSLLFIGQALFKYKKGSDIYKEAQRSFISFEVPELPSGSEDTGESSDEGEEALPASPGNMVVDFKGLKEVNSEVVGWIYIPETIISYPLVRGENNDYYLSHAYQGTSNPAGSIFMDFRNSPDINDQRTIIYGHNMLNGTQFTVLKKYSNEDFYKEHPRFYIITETGFLTYDVFSAHRAHTMSDIYQTDTNTEEGYRDFLNQAVKSSNIDTGIEVSVEDKTVTLSTCTSASVNERFVVHGKLAEDTRPAEEKAETAS